MIAYKIILILATLSNLFLSLGLFFSYRKIKIFLTASITFTIVGTFFFIWTFSFFFLIRGIELWFHGYIPPVEFIEAREEVQDYLVASSI